VRHRPGSRRHLDRHAPLPPSTGERRNPVGQLAKGRDNSGRDVQNAPTPPIEDAPNDLRDIVDENVIASFLALSK
jgi:hypothetical protein